MGYRTIEVGPITSYAYLKSKSLLGTMTQEQFYDRIKTVNERYGELVAGIAKFETAQQKLIQANSILEQIIAATGAADMSASSAAASASNAGNYAAQARTSATNASQSAATAATKLQDLQNKIATGEFHGAAGKSAYEQAVDLGFEGTVQEWLQSLKGERGADGRQGVDGYTPQRGIDYWTAEDVAAIVNATVTKVIESASSVDNLDWSDL